MGSRRASGLTTAGSAAASLRGGSDPERQSAGSAASVSVRGVSRKRKAARCIPATGRPTMRRQGHLQSWLDEHHNVPVANQEKMLRNDPSFRRCLRASSSG